MSKKKLRSTWGPGGDRGNSVATQVERTYHKREPGGRRRLVTDSVSVIEFKNSFRDPAGWRHGARISK